LCRARREEPDARGLEWQNQGVTSISDAERIRRRYPPTTMGWPLKIVLGALVAGALAWTVWTAASKADPPVLGRIDSFVITSDTDVTGRMSVQRPDPSLPVRCLVVVQAATFDRVGEKDVVVPAGGERLTKLEVTVRTFKRGTSMTVESCSPVG
jgi:hypothetical protein